MSHEPWRSWHERRTFGPPDPHLDELAAGKQRADQRISVCIPALNEEATIGEICRVVRRLMDDRLVDELIVVDSGSSDLTQAVAERAGAQVVSTRRVLPDHYLSDGGKGQAMWKGLSVVSGDIVCFLDADVMNFDSHFVTRLIAPLLADRSLVMAKAFYQRPLARRDGSLGPGGARVTELALRPLLQMLFPDLSGVMQPLAGECAARTTALNRIPFVSGYGVEIGMLVDIVNDHGLNALAQVDLGVRVHRNRPDEALGRTAFQVVQALLMRLEDLGRLKLPLELPDDYIRFDPSGEPLAMNAGVHLFPPLQEVFES